jgi:uncharacterized metal-binding protein YceD (DUF177 family)
MDVAGGKDGSPQAKAMEPGSRGSGCETRRTSGPTHMTEGLNTKTAWRPAEIGARKGVAFDLSPDAGLRADLARDLGILSVDALRFSGRITPEGRSDFRLEGDLKAEVEQACVVTLDPVPARIEERVVRRFLAEMPVPDEDESEIPEDDTAEPLGSVIDLTDVVREALALALPPYPRSSRAPAGDAAFGPDGQREDPDSVTKPFADLAKLLGKEPPER